MWKTRHIFRNYRSFWWRKRN